MDAAGRSLAVQKAVRQLALECVLAEIVQALEADGVNPLLLKGAAFARWLYDDPAHRPYNDLDLLVAPDQFAAALRVVGERGFEPYAPDLRDFELVPHHEVLVRHGALPAVVELHRTLFLTSAPASTVWQCLSNQPGRITVAGVRVPVPNPAAQALIVVLHALQHGTGAARPQRDLNQALARLDLATWRDAATLADALGEMTAFMTGLCLAPRGRLLVDQLGIEARPPSRRLQLLAATPPNLTMALEELITTRGLRPRLMFLKKELLPSPGFMRLAHPVAHRGRLGMAVAYAWRPLKLASQLPRAAAAWLRAATSGLSRSDPWS